MKITYIGDYGQIGHRLIKFIGLYSFCKLNNIKYVYTYMDDYCGKHLDKVIGLDIGEEIIEDNKFSQILYSTDNNLSKDFKELQSTYESNNILYKYYESKSGFNYNPWTVLPNINEIIQYKYASTNCNLKPTITTAPYIGIHLRRGDIIDENNQPFGRYKNRYISNKLIINLIQTHNTQHIIIHSSKNAENDIEYIKKMLPAYNIISITGNGFTEHNSLYFNQFIVDMINCEIFIAAPSGLSMYISRLRNKLNIIPKNMQTHYNLNNSIIYDTAE